MLPSMPALVPLPPATSTIRLDKVPGWSFQVVISTVQLLQILGVDQPFLPQMLEQAEIWP
jgi:hypothetical protein